MFFACDWEINKEGVEDIIPLTDAAAALNSIWLHRVIMTENGFVGARFIVEMPSETIFNEFLQLIVHLPFKNWYPIELSQSELPPSDLKPMGLSQFSPNSQWNILKGYYETAHLNAMKKQGIKWWL